MKFKIERWTIQKLIDTYTSKSLNLNPPYQRNNIWTEKAQMRLISTIKLGMPLPTFFFHDINSNKFDVADGQQRTRAILAYITEEITDLNKNKFNSSADKYFLDYEIPVVIIDSTVTPEEIRNFYLIVNNSGLKVNASENRKAEFYGTQMLILVEELANSNTFKSVDIFNERQSSRMIDREFVEELVAQIVYGIGDKKNDINKIYNQSFSEEELTEYKDKFNKTLSIISENCTFDITTSRYSQRNDFYTLFGFILENLHISNNTIYKTFLEILHKIEHDISPSNEEGGLLQFYAFNCISQSNSKVARQERFDFINNLLINIEEKPNQTQKEVLDYYKLEKDSMIKLGDYLLINPQLINTKFKK